MTTPEKVFAGLGSPRADDAEKYVLGSVLQDHHSLIRSIREHKLRATDFYLERHQLIYGA